MDPHLTPPGSRGGHGRKDSHDERRRMAVPRKSTRGPLDAEVDDPLSASQVLPERPSSSSSSSQSKIAARYHPRTASPTPSQASSLRSPPAISNLSTAQPTSSPRPSTDSGLKDYTYLLQPTTFHPLPTADIPPSFLQSPHQPSQGTPLPTLLANGHFRHAATSAATQLVTATSPSDHARIFALWHVRLACLCLAGHTALAAGEAKVLGDLGSEFYHDGSGRHLVPWGLRVLAVRLQALGFGEWRRGVMGYYELARDARREVGEAMKAGRDTDKRMWEARLRELGVRVADAVVEMGDLEGAGRHLASLQAGHTEQEHGSDADREVDERLAMYEALVWLRVGDLASARQCLNGDDRSPSQVDDDSSTNKATGILSALIQTADGDFTTATQSWRTLRTAHPSDTVIGQNLAVCLIYTGAMAEARDLLVSLYDTPAGGGGDDQHTTQPFQALTFNLATLYELCSERSRQQKLAMAVRDAERAPTEVGWEKATVDYKL